jgi:spectinomycin phosphotransferase
MRDDPGLDAGIIAACLEARYGLGVTSVTFLPLGYDPRTAVFRVVAEGASYFLKIRSGPVDEPGLLVPRALIDRGVRHVLAPLRARASTLWCPLDGYDGYTVVLYPFIHGVDAMVAGLTDEQWQEFGATLRAVHDSGLGERFRDQLRLETFALPSAALVRQMLAVADESTFARQVASRFAAFWREHADRIRAILARAEALGRSLQPRHFDLVLCHGDIHAANILVATDGQIWLVDWDGPLVATRERDLLFVVGSRIARPVEPREEDRFFEGYGPAEIDPTALAYYRYERIIEDLGEFGRSVFLDPAISEEARAHAAGLAMGLFAPGGDIDRAEVIPRRRWPPASA